MKNNKHGMHVHHKPFTNNYTTVKDIKDFRCIIPFPTYTTYSKVARGFIIIIMLSLASIRHGRSFSSLLARRCRSAPTITVAPLPFANNSFSSSSNTTSSTTSSSSSSKEEALELALAQQNQNQKQQQNEQPQQSQQNQNQENQQQQQLHYEKSLLGKLVDRFSIKGQQHRIHMGERLFQAATRQANDP